MARIFMCYMLVDTKSTETCFTYLKQNRMNMERMISLRYQYIYDKQIYNIIIPKS